MKEFIVPLHLLVDILTLQSGMSPKEVLGSMSRQVKASSRDALRLASCVP